MAAEIANMRSSTSGTMVISDHPKLLATIDELRPEPAKRGIALNFQVGVLEALFIIMQFVFGQVVLREMLRGMLTGVLQLILVEPYRVDFVLSVLSAGALTPWLVFQAVKTARVPWSQYLIRLKALGCGISQFAMIAMVLQVLATACIFAIQWWTGTQLLTLENLIPPQATHVSPLPMIEYVLVAPLCEELVFRLCIVSALYRRLGGFHYSHKRTVAVLSGIIFGALHGINLFSSKFSRVYVIYQILMGIPVGCLFSLRLMSNGLVEPILLHAVNNLFACFLTPSLSVDGDNNVFFMVATVSLVLEMALVSIAFDAIKRPTYTSNEIPRDVQNDAVGLDEQSEGKNALIDIFSEKENKDALIGLLKSGGVKPFYPVDGTIDEIRSRVTEWEKEEREEWLYAQRKGGKEKKAKKDKKVKKDTKDKESSKQEEEKDEDKSNEKDEDNHDTDGLTLRKSIARHDQDTIQDASSNSSSSNSSSSS